VTRKGVPKVRCVREEGRVPRGWLKRLPNVRWVREGGKEMGEMGWLKSAPSTSSTMEGNNGGRKFPSTFRWVVVLGMTPKEVRICLTGEKTLEYSPSGTLKLQ
jgi:hypothetical protein